MEMLVTKKMSDARLDSSDGIGFDFIHVNKPPPSEIQPQFVWTVISDFLLLAAAIDNL